MICERFADFLKHAIGEQNIRLFRWIKKGFGIGNTLEKRARDSVEEDKRYFRILKINIACGFITALILHADLFTILHNLANPADALSWDGYKLDIYKFSFVSSKNGNQLIPVFLFGCLGTGLFISFGSKFWHDLLDLLLEVKNYRRVLSDPNTYKIDKTATLDRIISTYPSDFIMPAFYEARTKFTAMSNVKSFSLKQDNGGNYYFDVILQQADPTIGEVYQYLLDGNIPQNINVRTRVLGAGEHNIAHSVTLGGKIFDVKTPDNWGTLGCLVKNPDPKDSRRYILTCCHNVIEPMSRLPVQARSINAGTIPVVVKGPIGVVTRAERDHEIDAALIEIDASLVSKIDNVVPQMGQPLQARTLKNRDVGKVSVFLSGAKSGFQQGVVTGLYCDTKLTYPAADLALPGTG